MAKRYVPPAAQNSFVKSGESPTSVAHVEPLLLDIPSAARLLSTTVWQIRSLLWARKIPHIKLGKKHLISPSDLHAYIQALKVSA